MKVGFSTCRTFRDLKQCFAQDMTFLERITIKKSRFLVHEGLFLVGLLLMKSGLIMAFGGTFALCLVIAYSMK